MMYTHAAALLGALFVLSACATPRPVDSRSGQIHTITIHNNNAHVLVTSAGALMIDAGLREDADALEQELRARGVDPASIRAVVITHGHADHVGGAAHFKKRYGAKIYAGRGDQEMIQRGTNDPLCPTDWIARIRHDQDQNAKFDPTTADVWVEDSMNLGELGFDVTIVPIAGHTPGSLVLVSHDVAFVGDLLRGAIVGGGAARHLYMCDLDDNTRDIKTLLTSYPLVRTMFTGHFGPVARRDVQSWLSDL